MNKLKWILSFLLVLVSMISLMQATYFERELNLNLTEGENILIWEQSYEIYAKELIQVYPEIQTITYYINNESVGYVNIFGGVGENFVLELNKTYEIFVKSGVKK